MDLTPIRIRGRKSRDNKGKQKNHRRRPGSTRSSTASVTPFTASQLQRAGQPPRKRHKTLRDLSPLEKLPVEILQKIFLETMNVSLPRSSRTLASKLSSEHVCMKFALRSLHWEGPLYRTAEDESTAPWVKLQSEVLACKFFTFPFFLRFAQKAREALISDSGRGSPGTLGQLRSEVGLENVIESTSLDFSKPESFPMDGLPLPVPEYLKLLEGARIPDKLLRGPWTREKTLLLYFLGSLGAGIDWENTSSGEVAKRGILDAIREGNANAVAVLLRGRNLGIAPTDEMLRAAVEEADFNKSILCELVSQAILRHNELDWFSPDVWSWLERERARGNPEGKWLRGLLIVAERASHADENSEPRSCFTEWIKEHCPEYRLGLTKEE